MSIIYIVRTAAEVQHDKSWLLVRARKFSGIALQYRLSECAQKPYASRWRRAGGWCTLSLED
eukprot:3833358-Pleurochrysis_carterae.AAC.1